MGDFVTFFNGFIAGIVFVVATMMIAAKSFFGGGKGDE
jgi:hypothetical protein